MARKKKEILVERDKVQKSYIEEIMENSYLEYALASIVRGIPDYRDGLKPSQRRILYAIRNQNTLVKSVRIVGDVLGHYHPHGDTSVYGAMVRLSQDFKVYVPMVIGHGNFGSLDGDAAAAMRYTEARISPEAREIYFNHNWNGVEYQNNFDNSTKEPVFLPATLPMVLINGVKGTAVGMSSQVPTHNVNEVINAYIAYIEGTLSNKNIFKYIKAPDPVIPCTVIRGKGLERAYLNGRGSFFCRMHHHIEEASRGRKSIVFTSTLPFQTKSKIIEELAAIITDKKASGPLQTMIANLGDESNMDSIRIVITLKKDAKIQTVLDALLAVKFSQIRVNFTMLVITENNKPQVLGLLDLFKKFYEFQKETSIRSLNASKDNLLRRLHIANGVSLVIKDYDRIIDIIRKAKNKEIAKGKISKLYPSLDDIQINSILDTKLITMINKGSDIMDDIKLLKLEIKKFDTLLSDIDSYLIEILKEQKKLFKSYKRRCDTAEENNGRFKLLKG